ncbi:MAG: hypothetical protein ACRDLF_00350 [Solirubrobacteraceae bacterium]
MRRRGEAGGLAFIRPFNSADGISEAERERVSAQFQDLVVNTLLNHAGDVRHSDVLAEESISLRLKNPKEPDVEWSIAVRHKTVTEAPSDEWESAEEASACIDIQRCAAGLGREMFSYRLGSDAVLRRVDLGDMYAKAQQRRVAGIGPRFLTGRESVDEMIQATEENLHHMLTVDLPNSRLEREMGLNDQPIGMQELQGLKAFVAQPGLDVPPLFKNLDGVLRRLRAA